MSDLFLQALRGVNHTPRPPIWLMRQAGRYMAAYRALRERYAFLEICTTPELIVEVTTLPITTFGFDAAILFSDILILAHACGLGLHFEETRGLHIESRIASPKDFQRLQNINLETSLSPVYQAIKILKSTLPVPLIGFAGAPFTLACYLIEGKSTIKAERAKQWLYTDPKTFHTLLDSITALCIEHLRLQSRAGVEVVQIFESFASILSNEQLVEFCLPYLRRIVESQEKPVILFYTGTSPFYEELAAIGLHAISLGSSVDIVKIRKKLPRMTLQGNLDPIILLTDSDTIKREARRLLAQMHGENYIFNLGHGVLPMSQEKNIHALVECVKEFC